MKRQIERPRRMVPYAFAVGVSAVALVVAGCASSGSSSSSAGSSSSASGKGASQFSILFTTEDTQTPDELNKLAAGACKSEASAMPLSVQQTPVTNLQQKVQLLAGQNALPFMYAADNVTIVPGGTYYKTGNVLDIAKALSDLGVSGDMTAVAESTIKQTFDGTVPSVPFQFNIEGLFYNKKIFAEQHLSVPTTYDELLSDAAKLKTAGITPISASGATGWTLARWIGILLYRELGPTAMQQIQDGKAKLTDPQYVKAAQQVADLGKAGYFSSGITSLDYNSAVGQFLTGKSAMIYMGTWLLAMINDPTQNTQGNNIGFMPFPAVTGGQGSIDQYPANAGSPNVINAKLYGTNGKAWLKCIADNYGSASLKDQGTFSGFRVNTPVTSLPPLTAYVQSIINKTQQSVLWFEAYFNSKATADADNNMAPLVTGQMSAQQYMSTLQSDLDSGS
ncbi:MAG: extracellular solute-binding protein [Streptosporangiaceae bacterium]|nr:extracellular solute-binding protein [Streptosporangiaceae bacterium]